MVKNNFFIVRHGESENNLLGIESTKLENKDQFGLSENGEIATKIEAEKFKNFDLIISSPFRRTKETALIFAEISQCEVIENDALREVCVGDFELCAYKKVDAFSAEQGESISFPNGESLLNAKKRVIEFFEQTDRKYDNKNILIVTHGLLVQSVLFHMYPELDWGNYWKEYDQGRKVFGMTA